MPRQKFSSPSPLHCIPKNTTTAHGDGLAALHAASVDQLGFITERQLQIIAADPATRLRLILVRCGGCRFLAPADQCQHVIDIITREGSDYVRDVSIPAPRRQKPARCPECGDRLTDRVEGDGKPTYCDTCDREVGE